MAVKRFAKEDKALMELHDIQKINNADQTAVLHEYVPKRNISDIGVKIVWVRCQGRSERTTATLLASSTDEMLTLFFGHDDAQGRVPAAAEGERCPAPRL